MLSLQNQPQLSGPSAATFFKSSLPLEREVLWPANIHLLQAVHYKYQITGARS